MKISSRSVYLVVIILISLLGGLLALYATDQGPWGYTDPVAYISTARSLAHGEGLGYYEADAEFKVFTIQPPFYPIVLSLPGLLQADLVPAARWLNILAFVASIFISGWIFLRYSRAGALGIIASALMCVFPYMLVMFSSAYSEPLFILLFLSSGWCLLAYLTNEKWLLFLLSALLVGLLPVTRYAGLAMLLAAVLTVLLGSSGGWRVRLKKTLLYALVAGLPILAWLVWVYFATSHSIGGRSLETSWSGLAAQFQAFRGIFMDTVWKWIPFQRNNALLRYSLRFILMGISLVVVVGLSMLAERKLRREAAPGKPNTGIHLLTYFGLSALIFVAVLIATYLFTFPTIDIDNRMLLPFYVGGVMSLLAGFALWQAAWLKGRLRMVQGVAWLAAVVCVAWYVPLARQQVEFYHAGGINGGLTAYHWERSELIQAVRLLPREQAVISNDWELLLLWTGRPIHGFWNTLPMEPIQTMPYGTNPADEAQTLFCSQAAALVILNDLPAQARQQVGEAEAGQVQGLFEGLSVHGTYTDGTIYLCP